MMYLPWLPPHSPYLGEWIHCRHSEAPREPELHPEEVPRHAGLPFLQSLRPLPVTPETRSSLCSAETLELGLSLGIGVSRLFTSCLRLGSPVCRTPAQPLPSEDFLAPPLACLCSFKFSPEKPLIYLSEEFGVPSSMCHFRIPLGFFSLGVEHQGLTLGVEKCWYLKVHRKVATKGYCRRRELYCDLGGDEGEGHQVPEEGHGYRGLVWCPNYLHEKLLL